MPDAVERLREWIEATEACKSFVTKYVTGTWIPSDEAESPVKADPLEALQEMDRLKHAADEKWAKLRDV